MSWTFQPPTKLACEGYWDKKFQPISQVVEWPEKSQWLHKVYAIERYLKSLPEMNGPWPGDMTPEERHQQMEQGIIRYRGLARSRIAPGEVVGNEEFIDYGMCWPGQYVEHYIENHNVLPTERFYQYVNSRYDTLPIAFR